MEESERVPGNGRIREYRKSVPTRTAKWSNQCEYRKMVESGRVPGKGRIRASIEKVSRRLPKKARINVSTQKK